VKKVAYIGLPLSTSIDRLKSLWVAGWHHTAWEGKYVLSKDMEPEEKLPETERAR